MMEKLIAGFSAQLTESLAIAANAKLSASATPLHNIVIAGMGGSGIGGNLVTAFTMHTIAAPIVINKCYEIPAFISANTLFIACSFSGGTEETIACALQAHAKGAKIVCITSGGKLGELAKTHGWDVISIPGHSGSPRASIGYSFVQIMKVLNFYGLNSTDGAEDFAAAAKLLLDDADGIRTEAISIAAGFKDGFPILYADSRLEAVVVRTQQQIAENSKQLSHVNVMPEMNHNELVGWDFPKALFKASSTLVLRSDFDNERTAMRMDICLDIFKKHSPIVRELKAKGKSFIEQSLWLTHVLDWVSYFLALENGVDPFPVDVITYLKNELAKH